MSHLLLDFSLTGPQFETRDVWEAPKPTLPSAAQDKVSIIRHLERNNPEALALAYDWGDVVHSLVKIQKKLAQ